MVYHNKSGIYTPKKAQGRITGESFHEVNRRRRSRRGIRENFHRLSGRLPGNNWIGVTIVVSLSKRHSFQVSLGVDGVIHFDQAEINANLV
jgi:hypothetical protein